MYKVPKPVEMKFCIETSSQHLHGRVKTSSDLLADDAGGTFAYFVKGNPTICRKLAKMLEVRQGDQVAFRSVEMPIAEEIVLEAPSEDVNGKPQVPKLVTVGMFFMNRTMGKHPVYGGVFTNEHAFKVVSVKGNSKHGFFKYSRFYSKVNVVKGDCWKICKNLYKEFSGKGCFGKLPTLKGFVEKMVQVVKVHSIVAVAGLRGCGKRAAVFKAGWKIGYRVREVSMCSIQTLAAFETLLSSQQDFTLLHIRQFNEGLSSILANQEEIIYKIRDILTLYLENDRSNALILSSSLSNELKPAIRNLCIQLQLPPPGAQDREFLLSLLLPNPCSELIHNSSGKTTEDLLNLSCLSPLTSDSILKSFKSSSSGIPNVKWEDVGGLQTAKQEIIDTVQLPLLHPEFFKLRPRSGLLLYGPPGTGKTLLAKAIATECSLNFISIKGPELLNMYIGESEKNVRELFDRARTLQPCVLFFDELDSLAPKRGQGSDLGVMDRIVSQLLTEIDSLQTAQKLFIIGATNRPDLLDPALLRPGRFDKMIYLGVPDDLESKVKVFEAQTYKFNLQVRSFELVAQACVGCYSGADIYAVCAQALADSYLEKVAELERRFREYVENEIYEEVLGFDDWVVAQDLRVVVTQEKFEQAVKKIRPTISEGDLDRYKYFGK